METNKQKNFDSVEFFLAIKQKLAEKLCKMALDEQKEFLKLVREGKIKLT